MITLNLISPDQKNGLRYQRVVLLTKRIGISITATIIVSIGFLVAAQFLLKNHLNTLGFSIEHAKKQITEEQQAPLDLETTIVDFNRFLATVSALQEQYEAWSDVLLSAGEPVPSGVILTTLRVQKDPAEFHLTGQAATRTALLAFKQALEESPLFDTIASPLSNLLIKENISFELTGTLLLP